MSCSTSVSLPTPDDFGVCTRSMHVFNVIRKYMNTREYRETEK